MNITNIGQALQPLAIHPLAAVSADGNSTGIDLQDYEGEIAIFLDCDAGTGSGRTLDVKVRESDDDSTFTDVTGGAFTQIGTTASAQKLVLNTNGLKRYIRVDKDISGTTPSYNLSIVGVAIKKYPA